MKLETEILAQSTKPHLRTLIYADDIVIWDSNARSLEKNNCPDGVKHLQSSPPLWDRL